MENENIDQKEKEKILRNMDTWLLFLDEHNDIVKLYELSDMMDEWYKTVD